MNIEIMMSPDGTYRVYVDGVLKMSGLDMETASRLADEFRVFVNELG